MVIESQRLYLAESAVLVEGAQERGGVTRETGWLTHYETRALLTIGYEGRTLAEILRILEKATVTLVVDVRLTPVSRKKGFSKHGLADELGRTGIEYLHIPALGNPRDNRAAFRRGSPRGRTRFRALMRGDRARDALDGLLSRICTERMALLCFEHDAKSCHRTLVADELMRRAPGLTVEDL